MKLYLSGLLGLLDVDVLSKLSRSLCLQGAGDATVRQSGAMVLQPPSKHELFEAD